MSSTLPTAPAPTAAVKKAKPPKPVRLKRGDHEFLPAALEILETPLSPVRSGMLVTICLFAAVALAWSYIGRIDIIAVAQGKIQPVGRTKTIQPLETGRVQKLLVANGQAVKAGEVLIELDPSESQADEATFAADLASFRAEARRRDTALSAAARRTPGPAPMIAFGPGVPAELARREQRVLEGDLGQLYATVASFEAQARTKMAEKARLQATVQAQENLVQTLKERVDMRSSLFETNSGSKAAVIDAREVMQTQLANLASQRGQLGEAESGILLAQRDIEKTYNTFLAENAAKLAEADRQADDLDKKLAKARIKTSHMTIASPIDGVVQGLTVTTVGQVITTGEQIMQIVPEGAPLEIEAYMPNADIGFIEKGQTAVVKVESFPFTTFGTIDATVTRVASDAIPDVDAAAREQNPAQATKGQMFGGGQRTQNLVFPVNLVMARNTIDVEGRSVPLGAGMAVTVEIKTGTRRILSYLLSPLVQVISTSMKER